MKVQVTDTTHTVVVNPTIHTVQVQTGAGLQGAGFGITQDTVNPSSAPSAVGRFWHNTVTNQLWVSFGSSTVNDWYELIVGGNP